jgi:hypothetical protein
MKTIRLTALAIAMLIFTNECQAQSQEKMYALMLLNFAKGIHWPHFNSEYFTVGIIEYPPLLPELEKTTSNSKIYGKKIKVISITDLEDISSCQIVFLPAYKSKLLTRLLESASNKPTLIVSNKMDLVKKGGGIDLVLREGKLTFDINSKAIEQRGLKISTSIKSSGNVLQ